MDETTAELVNTEKLSKATIVKLVIIGVLLALVLVCAVGLLVLSGKDTIFPNVSAAGVDLSGMTLEEAEAALNNQAQALYGDYVLTVVLPDRTATIDNQVLQLTPDAAATAQKAYEIGREGGLLQTALARLRAGKAEPTELSLSVTVSGEEALRSAIASLAAEVQTEAEESSVTVDEDMEKIVVYIGKEGQSLDEDGLYDAILAAVPEETELTFDYTYHFSSAVDLSQVYASVHKDVADAYYDEATGNIVDEQIGYGFDLEAANQQLRLAEGGQTVEIIMQTEYPSVTRADLEAIYFTDVIGSCKTYGLGGSSRATNITLACQAINGVVVAPGATFSYNQTLGERTEEKGYKYAGAYVNGKSVSEVGGGICQVSSTLYNCVLQANLEVLVRSAHVYAVGYVDLGMDATVSWGGPDFQFRNNTENPIRIEAEVSGGYVYVRLMGTPTGVTVKMTYKVLSVTPYTTVVTEDEEEVNDVGRDGKTVVTYRNVYDADGNLISSEVEDYSYYQRSDIVVLKEDFDEAVEKKREEEEQKKEEEEKKAEEEEKAAEEAAKTKKT